MPELDLHGCTVVVTRPAHQADNLCRLIEAAGGKVILFPVLAIAPPQDPQAVLSVLQRLAQFDLAVFISPNAVDYGLRYAAQAGGVPSSLQIAAVGAGTARELHAAGHPPTLVPEHDFNSEALLALSALQQVTGKKVIIFRGEGGREHLANTLRSRGAQVEYVQVYRREKPPVDRAVLLEAWARNGISAIVVTSNESLQNLFDLIGSEGQVYLRDTQLVLVSQRAVELAQRLGVRRAPLIAERAGDNEIVAVLAAHKNC
ncbi:MAG: uroporphyrinogen-III synthase [Gammaproteobacteria bacterium]|nr:uroporphyrinogen-III synthase [Gammaproteobacteria bacterium]